MGLLRTALIFGAGYAVGDPNTRRQLVAAANDLMRRPELEGLRDRGRTAVARVTRRTSTDSEQYLVPAAEDAGSDTAFAVPPPASTGRTARATGE